MGSTFAILNLDRDGDASQTQNSSILSAYHGLDQLPLVASVLCGFNVAGDDGMPVVFSTQLNVDSVDPESFLVTRSDGEVVVPNCATLTQPMSLELRTVLLTGDFGTFGETPLRVEVTGPLLTIDGESLLGLSTEDITPLEDGPRVVLAERFTRNPGLAEECPDGTAGPSSSPGRKRDGPRQRRTREDQRLGTLVLLEDGTTVNPVALVDDDPDNHVLACLAEESPAQRLLSRLDCSTTRAIVPTQPPRSKSLTGRFAETIAPPFACLERPMGWDSNPNGPDCS